MAGYAEGDVAVLMPPFLKWGCQGEIVWRLYWYRNIPWKPFSYDAMAAMGGVLSLEVLNDFTDYNLALYEPQNFWMQRAIAGHSFVGSINQMETWYMYAMASVDEEGLPWSDGRPWNVQYVRKPPSMEREPMQMVPYGGEDLPHPNATIPSAKGLRLCNGWFPHNGTVLDSAHGWEADSYKCSGAEGQSKVVVKANHSYNISTGPTRLRNLHFQGKTKVQAKERFRPLMPWLRIPTTTTTTTASTTTTTTTTATTSTTTTTTTTTTASTATTSESTPSTTATNPRISFAINHPVFGHDIPVVYAFFRADIKKDAGGRTVWDSNTSLEFPEYFFWTLGASLLHAPAVVLLTDPAASQSLRDRFPASLMSRLHVYDYLRFCDEKVWKLKHVYDKHIREVWGKKEPFEKMNVINFFVLRSWLEQEGVPMASYAEADVAILVPPYLRQGCQGEIAWRTRWDKNKEWQPFGYDAMAVLGGVLSLEVMNDFTDFNLALYEKANFWLQRAIAKHSIVGSINQMETWYMYAMASLDEEGLPWSDGQPWKVQYVRKPPSMEREPMQMVPFKDEFRELPHPNVTLPQTQRLRLCNAWFPHDGFALDAAHGWSANPWVSCGAVGNSRTILDQVNSKFTIMTGNTTLRNLHFQGQSKNQAMKIFEKLMPWLKKRALRRQLGLF
ncbi:unnamed protein product [Effrenium voratum]|nr:unnamed protein product [Effrenium voratum]